MKKYRAFVDKHKDLVPDFELVPLTQVQNHFQYVGGQIINGKLYSIINSAE